MAFTIILALWPGAHAKAVGALMDRYRETYHEANVELLHSTQDCRPQQSRNFGTKDRILLHTFGDQALSEVCRMLRAHLSTAGAVLDVDTFIFDTPPATASWLLTLWPGHILQSTITWTLQMASKIVKGPLYDANAWTRNDLIESRLLPATTKLLYATRLDAARTEACIGSCYMPEE